jgi:hypothetical protein
MSPKTATSREGSEQVADQQTTEQKQEGDGNTQMDGQIAKDVDIDMDQAGDMDSSREDSAGDQAGPSGADLVSQLQIDLAQACEHLFVGIGSLQRDAKPVPLDDEEVVRPSGGPAVPVSGEDIEATARNMGMQLKESLHRLELGIKALPDGLIYDTSERMGQKAASRPEMLSLVEENANLRGALEEAVIRAEEHATRLEAEHKALFDEYMTMTRNR